VFDFEPKEFIRQSTSQQTSLTHSLISNKSLFRIRYFDLLILIPNVLMFCFLILKCFQKRNKLTFNKPLTLTIYSLIIGITITNIIRCTFVMIYAEQGDHKQELIAKVNTTKK